MSINFAEKYGLPADRMKLKAGLQDFDIVKIVLTDSKKKVDKKEEGIDGSMRIVRKTYKIAYIDVIRNEELEKYYSPNAPIVEACENILKDFGNKDGILKEKVHINEVKEGDSETGNTYLFFS